MCLVDMGTISEQALLCMYVCWQDKRTVTAISVALPGHGAEFIE